MAEIRYRIKFIKDENNPNDIFGEYGWLVNDSSTMEMIRLEDDNGNDITCSGSWSYIMAD